MGSLRGIELRIGRRGTGAGLDLGHLGLNPSNSCYGLHFSLLADIVHRAGRAEFAAREDGAGNDHDEGDDDADDRADVRLAAVVFVRSAADVLNATNDLRSLHHPVVPLALGFLREAPALAVIELVAAHVAAGGGANREGDEREEVLRNKHGGLRGEERYLWVWRLRQPFGARGQP